MELDIFIDNRSNEALTEQQEALILAVIKEAAADASDKWDKTPAWEVSLSIVENAEIQQLNKQYRGIDKPTDVLSFPMEDFEADQEPILLGDIVISMEKAREQALDYGHSLERELGFLTCHGMLHLLGDDHMNPEEESAMIEKQERILQKVGSTR